MYVAVTFLGVLNVLTAVFVESALQSSADHRDLLVADNEKNRHMVTKHLEALFTAVDEDCSGLITQEEVEIMFADMHVKHFLQALEITANDAMSLFKLLDIDGSGAIDIFEFCDGCMKLKGEAKSYDIHCLMYESRRVMKTLNEFLTMRGRPSLQRIQRSPQVSKLYSPHRVSTHFEL